ncbi:MAG: hypothetical protein ACLU8D_14340, partial [Enterocloster sp.]
VSGPEMIVIPELAILMRALRKEMTEKHGQEYADNRMRECIKFVFLTEEEIKAESTRKLEELKTKGPFEKMMAEILEEIRKAGRK